MNRLAQESSPYLLQHAHNPVDWYPWCDAAFERAQKENKPVLVSIGYAACHWCHVMEKESFEDAEIAEYMNAHFINIKVDREERPDVDHFYMDALQAMNGQGGWPLNMFVTPDRKPFYGGTYFPPKRLYQRASWMETLEAIRVTWAQKPDAVLQQSEQLIRHLQQLSQSETDGGEGELGLVDFKEIAFKILANADTENGGFGVAPKFPQTMSIQYLLEHYRFTQHEDALQQAVLSLDKMLAGGIYDQLGGGLARYATDNEWLVPHFEKMLYDNALLVQVLSDAYRITKKESYKKAIVQTIDFCIAELSINQSGIGFYSAIDADSEGVEGKYYTWSYEDIIAAIPDLHPALAAYWGITNSGNWEGVNILHIALSEAVVLQRFHLQKTDWDNLLKSATDKLLSARKHRIAPQKDTKILLSWNALFCTALIHAGMALSAPQYIQLAYENLCWLQDTFLKAEKWYHVYDGKTAKVHAHIDDYAFLIAAIIAYSQATTHHVLMPLAKSLAAIANSYFSDEEGVFYYFSPSFQQDILVRKIEQYDAALPSANAVMMHNLRHLSVYFGDDILEKRAQSLQRAMRQLVYRYPSSFGHWATLFQRAHYAQTLVIVGEGAPESIKAMHQYYCPQLILYASATESSDQVFKSRYKPDDTMFYVCEHFRCLAPENDLQKALLKIKI